MNKLKFLGRGSAFNVKEGNTSAYVKENNTLLLIDCGESIFKTIIEKNLLDGVKNVYVLITHCHSDHVGSLSSFLFYCYYIKNIKANVYHHNIKSIEKFLLLNDNINEETYHLMGLLDKHIDELGLDFDSDPVLHKSIYAYDNGRVTRDWAPNYVFECYGYFLKFNDGNYIYYSGDSSYLELDLILLLDKDLTTIYHDACLADYEDNAHTSLRLLCEKIEPKYRDRVYCMHIDCDELIEKAECEGFNIVEVE